MLKVRIIPCLDVKNGRIVKGVNFVDLVDAGDPVEAAKAYDAGGADELCFLDITASHEKRPILLDVVKRTAEQCFMPLTVGGGVSSIEDIQNLLSSGADKVSINTSAVKNPTLIREASEVFGSQCIVVAIDAKKIGQNCTVNQCVSIGADYSGPTGKKPVLGDNVFVGSGAKILGNVVIGDNVVIAANALVLKSVPDNCTVSGVPARIISRQNTSSYLKFDGKE